MKRVKITVVLLMVIALVFGCRKKQLEADQTADPKPIVVDSLKIVAIPHYETISILKEISLGNNIFDRSINDTVLYNLVFKENQQPTGVSAELYRFVNKTNIRFAIANITALLKRSEIEISYSNAYRTKVKNIYWLLLLASKEDRTIRSTLIWEMEKNNGDLLIVYDDAEYYYDSLPTIEINTQRQITWVGLTANPRAPHGRIVDHLRAPCSFNDCVTQVYDECGEFWGCIAVQELLGPLFFVGTVLCCGIYTGLGCEGDDCGGAIIYRFSDGTSSVVNGGRFNFVSEDEMVKIITMKPRK